MRGVRVGVRVVGLGLGLLCAAGCGGAVCGNGKIEAGEQCDDGNTVDGDGCSPTCQSEATIDDYVHWTFIHAQYPGFDGETCLGLGVARVEVTLAGPKALTESAECSFAQIKLSSLPAGAYVATAKAYDAGGAALTMGRAKQAFTVAGATQDIYVDFPYEDFVRSYTGTYYFGTRWGGQSCVNASPAVARERVLLERGGVALSGKTTADATPIDGSKAGPCHDDGDSSRQSVTGLPWGPAKITLGGEDPAGRVLFRKTFDTFVGAGDSNPSFLFDVPSTLPDAGVPDARGADAPLADAGGP